MLRDEFSVTVLGSGTCTPSTRRQTAAYLLRASSRRYLVDSGSGTIARLMACGLPIHDLDGLFYTHLHLDHTGDLFPLLFALRNSMVLKRTRDLPIFGPPGFAAFFDQLFQIYGRWVVSADYQLPVLELGTEGRHVYPVDGLMVEAIAMRHTPSSMGYRFRDAVGRVIAFTGDADDGPNLIPLFAQADLVITDCSMPDALKVDGHLSPGPIGVAAAAAGPRRVILSHLYPPAEPADLEAEVHRFFDGDVERAEDGRTYAVL